MQGILVISNLNAPGYKTIPTFKEHMQSLLPGSAVMNSNVVVLLGKERVDTDRLPCKVAGSAFQISAFNHWNIEKVKTVL